MKYVCERACQIRKDGRIITVSKGMVLDLDEPKNYFRLLGEKLDFATAGEEELLEAEFDLEELKQYIKDTYGKNPGNRGKEKTIAMLLDCRYREVDADRLKNEVEQVI